ncbi:MAG TPA: hypothetical protein DHM90_11160, partial [Clostridiaceae bacterium]|nr:hypothetical protein [Clostridiaceae bacterium]
DRAVEAAKQLAKKMGVIDPLVAHHKALDQEFTFFVVYGSLQHSVNYEEIIVESVGGEVMDMDTVNEFVRDNIGRKLVV